MSETPVTTFEATASFSAFFTADFPIFLTPCQAALLQTDVPAFAAADAPAEPIRIAVVSVASTTETTCSVMLLSHAPWFFAQPIPHWTHPGGPSDQHIGPTPFAPTPSAPFPQGS